MARMNRRHAEKDGGRGGKGWDGRIEVGEDTGGRGEGREGKPEGHIVCGGQLVILF